MVFAPLPQLIEVHSVDTNRAWDGCEIKNNHYEMHIAPGALAFYVATGVFSDGSDREIVILEQDLQGAYGGHLFHVELNGALYFGYTHSRLNPFDLEKSQEPASDYYTSVFAKARAHLQVQ